MDVSFPACNKRSPGSGCAAIDGYNRIHAILGQTDKGATNGETCIATHPSDMCVAMAALGATVEVEGPKGKRFIPFADFHELPGRTPSVETSLRADELIVAVMLPPAKFSRNSYYLKIRDRNSYAFALVSVAAGLEMDSGTVKSAGIALGGVALKNRGERPKRRSCLLVSQSRMRHLWKSQVSYFKARRAMSTTHSKLKWRSKASFAP